MRVGLRFNPKDKRRLIALAHEFEGQPGIDSTLYRAAAEAARTGEPLIVECTMEAEVHQMAALFVHLGVTAPNVEELSGSGGGARPNMA